MSCALNPIEHFWSTVKSLWAKEMSKLETNYDEESLVRCVDLIVARCQERLTGQILSSFDSAAEKVNHG